MNQLRHLNLVTLKILNLTHHYLLLLLLTLSVGIVDAATLKYDGLSVHTSIADNASVAAAASAAVEARRVANIAGAVSTITTGNLTASRALASDGSGKVAVSAVTATN